MFGGQVHAAGLETQSVMGMSKNVLKEYVPAGNELGTGAIGLIVGADPVVEALAVPLWDAGDVDRDGSLNAR